jgi:iron complex outermembrane receptor protein
VNAAYTASGYNPTLKPITSTMFDLSLEHYFSPVGSVTIAGFYKNFQNYIQYGSQMVDYSNNGVTRSIEVRTPINGEGGKIYGFEAAYQQFFDFLPGALKGLGVQANVTYVKNDGITNSGLKTQNGTDGGGQAQPGSGGTTLTVGSLEGLSKWTYNLVGMYERSGLAVRLAYNWRSEFLVTAVDCCTYLPTWQKAAGFLDASVRYAVSPKIEFSIQGTNLLNTITKLEQQVTGVEDGALLRPNAWFRNDRRVIAGVRVKF